MSEEFPYTPEPDEPVIDINGQRLSLAQAMTVRVAIETFAIQISQMGLGDDLTGKAIAKNYLARLEEIRRIIFLLVP